MKNCTIQLLLVLAMSCLSIESRAQESPSQEPLRLKTELVQIDVVVTDKKGVPIPDLKKEDFQLFEEGTPQQISFFSLVKPRAISDEEKVLPAGEPSKRLESTLAAAEPGRLIFLILDQFHISSEYLPRLKDSLLWFVSEGISPQDQVAVIGTRGNIAIFHQVTKDKRILGLAIKAFLGTGSSYKSQDAVDEAFAKAQEDMGIPVSETPKLTEQQQMLYILKRLVLVENSPILLAF